MGVTWTSPSSRSASGSHPARAVVAGIRRLATLGRVALPSAGSPPVELSEWRGVLETLRQLHKVAAGSTNREAVPVPRWGFLTPAALTFDRGAASCSDAGASRVPVDVRAPVHDPASSVRVAAQHAARSHL